jgi:outer membrane protein assembly factor BamE (lipoprotein component of BamABCDE complex)
MTSVSLICKYIMCQIRQKLGNLILGLFCFAILFGCGERVSEHGHAINQVELDTIEIGRTTKADIIETLGQPSFEGAFDSQKLYYVSQVMEAPVAGINTTKTRTIYTFTFNNENLLQSIDLKDKDSGLSIAHIDEKTPTPGDTFGVFDQILTNVMRGQAQE